MKPRHIVFAILILIFIISGCSKFKKEILSSSFGNCDAAGCHPGTALHSYYPTDSKLHQSHINALESKYTETCSLCHYSYDNRAVHKNSFIDGSVNGKLIVFFDTSVNQNATWDMDTKSCENLSCHGNIAWDPNSPSTCVAICHQEGNTFPESAPDPSENGSHSAHMTGTGLTCVDCHYNYNESTTHGDGNLDSQASNPGMISFNPAADSGGSYDPATGLCSDTYCHGNFPGGNSAMISWNDSSVACGSCHDIAPSNAKFGSHDKHTDSDKYKYDCGLCHNGIASGDESGTPVLTGSTLHVNFKPDVIFRSEIGSGSQYTGLTPGYDPDTLVCSNTYCHGNFAGGNAATVSWNGGSATCGSCHGLAPSNAKFGSHDKHTDSGKYNYDCGLCHDGIASGNESGTPVLTGSGLHINFEPDVIFSGLASQYTGTSPEYDKSTRECSGTYCHGAFGDGATQWNEGNFSNTPTWGGSAQCGSCHGQGANAALGIPTADNIWNLADESHAKHAGYNAQGGYQYPCGFCHNGVYDATLSAGNGIGGAYETGTKTPDYDLHADGIRTPLSFYTAFTSSGSATVNDLQDVTCSGLYCHSDGWDTLSISPDTGGISSPEWGGSSKSAIACDSCHRNGSGSPAPHHNSGGRDHYSPGEHETTCAHCHQYVTTASGNNPGNSSDTILFGNNRHVNRMKNVSFGMDTESVSGGYSYSRTSGRCYVRCHGESHNSKSGWYGSSFSGLMIYEP